jgi:hypothetical protein
MFIEAQARAAEEAIARQADITAKEAKKTAAHGTSIVVSIVICLFYYRCCVVVDLFLIVLISVSTHSISVVFDISVSGF